MAETENKVNPGSTGDKPQDLTADGADKNVTEKDGAGLKITGITFVKGVEAEKKAPEVVKTDGTAKDIPPVKKADKGEKSLKADKGVKPEKPLKTEKGDEKPISDKKDIKEKPAPAVKKDDKGEKTPKVKKTREPKMPGETKRGKGAANIGGAVSGEKPPETPKAPEPPSPPKDATRPGAQETIVYIDHAELFPFKNHPFQVRDDADMKNLVESVKDHGVDQPALVRPREDGGYELVAGHRRQYASEQAGLKNIPCVVREMTDDEAILAMTESNLTYRSEIVASERAQALKMQLDAIKRQGARFDGVAQGDVGKRSVEIIAERNNMNYKTVQRYIALNNLVPEMMKFADEGKLKFIPAFEASYITPKNQQYIAMTIESEERVPTLAQVQRMRELDQKGQLTSNVIDGIMLEENKKEDRKVVFNSQELDKYFSAEKTPAEMKEVILKAMDEYKEKQPLEFGKPEKLKDKEL